MVKSSSLRFSALKIASELFCVEIASEKAKALLTADCTFSEFGTRRRRSYHTQDVVVGALVATSATLPGQGKVTGTSNVSAKAARSSVY